LDPNLHSGNLPISYIVSCEFCNDFLPALLYNFINFPLRLPDVSGTQNRRVWVWSPGGLTNSMVQATWRSVACRDQWEEPKRKRKLKKHICCGLNVGAATAPPSTC
jgi:hypothetical protein